MVLFFIPLAAILALAGAQNQPCWNIPQRGRGWEFIPCEDFVHNADPVARVFDGRLYVYTSWDSKNACGDPGAQPAKKQGFNNFCMPGYRVYSTADETLRRGWLAHGPILREETVPWVYRGDDGWKGAARMWAIDVIQGDDGRYYLFFPAPMKGNDMRIGVAVAEKPAGPFWPRRKPIPGKHGIDPSVILLASGEWAVFTSGNGNIYVQRTNRVFNWAGPRKVVTGLKPGYKEGPHAEIREGRLYLYYSVSIPGKGYAILQAAAFEYKHPERGFWDAGLSIASFDGRTNHAFNVYFKGTEWMFYHRHFENHGEWTQRKVIFSKAKFNYRGIMKTIKPHFNMEGDFRV